jgi:hypothetical protein
MSQIEVLDYDVEWLNRQPPEPATLSARYHFSDLCWQAALIPFVIGQRHGVRGLSMQVQFIGGTGGTACDVKIQTSIDGSGTWCDVWHCTSWVNTPGRRAASVMFGANEADYDATAALGSGLVKSIMGGHLRAIVTTTGVYTNSSVQVDVFSEQLAPA